jgi:lipopolysaccharide/colanic/teichoic acid biosynthesis glycosyltransferase
MQLIAKNILDKLFAFILIILLIPLILLISILISLGGPIFILQPRLGKHGKMFLCIKFRTMIVNADDYLDDQGVPTIDRVTKIGKFLRNTSLDEIPQLINIVLGQMSFIGPRPTLVSHWNRYTEEQKKRSKMLPGITGLAQVNGRNSIPWSKRIELDLEYIQNYSLWLDIIILFKTINVVLLRKNIVIDRNSLKVDDLGEDKNEK